MNTPDVIYLQFDEDGKRDTYHIERINDNDVEYIRADLPVDRVRAMALFVRDAGRNRYYVPDTSMKMYTVDFVRGTRRCHDTKEFTLCSQGDCDHVRAVEMHREQKKNESPDT